MTQLLANKVFAITGGASGIGLATAKILAGRGATVCIGDVDPAALSTAEVFFTSQDPPWTVEITRLDVSKRAEVDAWIEKIVGTHGRIDGAANVAGIIGKAHGRDAVADLDDDEWDRILAVNLTGMMYCLRAELRAVVDGGSIVNISSVHGTRGKWWFLAFVPNPPRARLLTRFAPRICTTRRIRCEQARRNRSDESRGAGERRERSAGQRRGAGGDIHAPDAETLGSRWPLARCTVR